MHPSYYPIPRLTIALICGIFLSFYVSLEIYIILILLGVVFCLGLFFHFKTSIYKSIISSYFLLLLFVVLGVFISQLHYPKAQKNHYSYFLKKTKQTIYCCTSQKK